MTIRSERHQRVATSEMTGGAMSRPASERRIASSGMPGRVEKRQPKEPHMVQKECHATWRTVIYI